LIIETIDGDDSMIYLGLGYNAFGIFSPSLSPDAILQQDVRNFP